jgi:hypothetical protein
MCFKLPKIAFFNTDNAVYFGFETPSRETEKSGSVSKCFEWEKPIKYSQARNRYYHRGPQTQQKGVWSAEKYTCRKETE